MPTLDFSGLNPPQREAVEHLSGPSLVLAGAGSGKTRVLTYKIAHLVANGVKPWRILAVTFTNKAAREMAARAETLLAMPSQGLWIGTFHGICVRVLRREAENWGFSRDFTIYDDDDRRRVIKKALADLHIPTDRLAPAKVRNIISKAKNDFIAEDELGEYLSGPDAEVLVKVYERYHQRMREANAFDFDDLLVAPVRMFSKHADALERWRNRFDHILVDEYQDTNRTQYLLLKLLAAGHGNITVVGDDDQSIYKWRGADIRNILEFERDYGAVKTVRLEQNYRSTGTILAAANSVVANNQGRMAKKLWTDRGDGEKIAVLECRDDRDEADRVVSSIQRCRDADIRLRDMVVLYRTNAQSRPFEDVLRRRSIPYTIVGGLRFYERREIKDILAYLRVLANPGDEVSFARAVSTPRRGIGDKTIEAVETFARDEKISLLDALGRSGEYLSGATAGKVAALAGTFNTLRELRGAVPISDLCRQVVVDIGYDLYLQTSEPESAEERIDNVDELITAMGEFENHTDDDDLSAFLAEVSLVSDVDSWDADSDVLTLMSLHAAKGLEFPHVYIAGVERGLFPLPSAFDQPDELEEERRLFYVGITRAEDRLFMSYALSRFRHGAVSGGASPFVSEIPWEIVEIDAPEPLYSTGLGGGRQHDTPRRQSDAGNGSGGRYGREESSVYHATAFEDFSQESAPGDPYAHLTVGAFVKHPKFGRGRITAVSGHSDQTMLTIRFNAGEKKILAKFGRLLPA